MLSVVMSLIPGSGSQGCHIIRNAIILVGTGAITCKGSARGDRKLRRYIELATSLQLKKLHE